MIDVSLVKSVAKIAKKAGDAILKVYNEKDDFEIQKKSDNSPLTLADQAANQVICEGLEKLNPKFPIISEENKSVDYQVRKNYDYYWLVDPLDGTKEFIKRNGEFTVNIALVHRQRPILGVVYTPVSDELFYALKNNGAFSEKNGKVEQLDAASFSKSEKNLGVVCSRSHLNEATQHFVDQLDQPQLVATGSSLKFLILAEGKAHLYPRLAPTMEWDTGAAQIILEEAGGQVLQADSKESLLYNKENLLNPHFVAMGKMTE